VADASEYGESHKTMKGLAEARGATEGAKSEERVSVVLHRVLRNRVRFAPPPWIPRKGDESRAPQRGMFRDRARIAGWIAGDSAEYCASRPASRPAVGIEEPSRALNPQTPLPNMSENPAKCLVSSRR